MPADDPTLKAITGALDNQEFEWRTVPGIAKETKLDEATVLKGLEDLIRSGVVLRSTVSSRSGDDLYTTRERYQGFASPLQKFGAALRNRAS